MKQFKVPVQILRYAHTFGPGMDLQHDPRSFVSFIRQVVAGEDIVLFSQGDMTRCFCYLTDATRAFFHVLFKGRKGEAYNIANPQNEISILNLARLLADLSPAHRTNIIMNAAASPQGYAPQKLAPPLDIQKLTRLGFVPAVSIRDGFSRCLKTYLEQ